jgi:muconate cycloisomerase
MRPTRFELLWLRIPFQRRFAHARSERTEAETMLVVASDGNGMSGFGEVLPRSYVTGEELESCFNLHGPVLAASLLGREFATQDDLVRWTRAELEEPAWGPALFGGFEGSLLDLHDQAHGVDFGALLGPPRADPPGYCVTIGFECPTAELRKRAMAARLRGATAVKLKVGGDGDAERVAVLAEALGTGVALRLDGNGVLSLDEAIRLLEETREMRLHSLEQPFAPGTTDLLPQLTELHARSGVDLMADESVCTVRDARRWLESGGYQWFNVRVGKSGGLLAAAALADLASSRGIKLVSGTMVGETAVLDRSSELLLRHTKTIPYVEGLGQHRFLLAASPVRRIEVGSGRGAFALDPEVVEQCLVARRIVGG